MTFESPMQAAAATLVSFFSSTIAAAREHATPDTDLSGQLGQLGFSPSKSENRRLGECRSFGITPAGRRRGWLARAVPKLR
jgi:hypothetical protein